MRRVATILVFLFILTSVVSCSKIPVSLDPGISVNTPTISVPGIGLSPSDTLKKDEFLVARTSNAAWLAAGKMLTGPTESKHEAEFLTYNNSRKAWME